MCPLPRLAFIFDSAGLDEWAFLGAIVFLLFGPKRLPEIARTVGRTLERIRRAAEDFRGQLARMDEIAPSSKLQALPPSAPIRPDAHVPVNSGQSPANVEPLPVNSEPPAGNNR
jgi:TatA/E family protein of Tat protein translocase